MEGSRFLTLRIKFWRKQHENQIIIREAISEADTAAFWEQLHTYHKRDIFPDPNDENLTHF